MIRWIAAAGAFTVSLDSTVNIAFPAIATAFAVPPEAMRWVILCYVSTYAVTSFVGGALADRAGHAAVFRAGVALSAAGFAVAGLAPTFGGFLAGRVVQGLGGGLVYGTAPGLVTLAAAPGARLRDLAFLNAAIAVAFSIGPAVAGALVDTLGWRSVFHVRVPVAVATLAWALAALPARAAGGSPPRLRFHDLLRPPVMQACATAFASNAGIFAVWLLAPFALVVARGLPVAVAGALFALTPIGTAAAAPVAGRAADRLGSHRAIVVGLAVEAAGLVVLSRAHTATALPVLALALLAAGFGLGFAQVPTMAAIMSAFPAGQQGLAGGLAFLARTLGIVAGVTGLSALFAARRAAVGIEAAFGEAFVLAAAVVVVAALLAGLRVRGDR